jgi:hypothetical protein
MVLIFPYLPNRVVRQLYQSRHLHGRSILPMKHSHAVNLRHKADCFTSPPKKVVLRIFIAPLNTHGSRVGLEPATFGPRGKHATSRPLRPIRLEHAGKNSQTCNEMIFFITFRFYILQWGETTVIPRGVKDLCQSTLCWPALRTL